MPIDTTDWSSAQVEVSHLSWLDSGDAIQGERVGQLFTAQPTPLVDRADELEIIRTRLVCDGVRLLTLTGPAGVGKTRVAVAAAAQLDSEFSDGVVLVELGALRSPQLVLPTMAQALGVADTGGVSLLERLGAYLHERTLLLVLDNFEHVLPAACQLADLLAACPHLALLLTSRFLTHLRWEQVLRVKPLPVPDVTRLPPLDELARIPSVALFLERARARQADFALTEARAPLVAQVVVHLDGLPLALELAAARLDVLPLPVLVRCLADRMRLLASPAPDAPERQYSLEAAVTWSYELLSPQEQRLFRHVGVFGGRVAPSAVAAVLGDADPEVVLGDLASLAEKSLIVPVQEEEGEDQHGFPVFRVLETMREFAREQLVRKGELETAERAHAHYFEALAARADVELRGPDQQAWFLRLERERDNLRAALRWVLDRDDPARRAAAPRLAGAMVTDRERRMRLLGAATTVTEAAEPALAVWGPSLEQRLAALCARVEPEGWGAACRAGHELPVEEVAVLIGEMLEDVARACEDEPQPAESQEPARQQQPSLPEPNSLTEREHEVLRLVAQGHANKAIARQLVISPSTVNYHLNSIFHKLTVDTRAQAVAVAVRQGLL